MISTHESTTRSDLYDVPLVRPEGAGGYWRGIQHGELVDAVANEATKRQWQVARMRFALSRDGVRLALAYDFHSVKELPNVPGLRYSLGLLADNGQERAMRLYVGAVTETSDNGLVLGSYALHRHTIRFDLRNEMESAFDRYLAEAARLGDVVVGLQNRRLRWREYSRILLSAGRLGLMPWSRLGKVDEQYRCGRPLDDVGPGTSWNLLNAFASAVKLNPPHKQMDQLDGFRPLLPTAAA